MPMLSQVISETLNKLLEGGKAMGTDRIAKADVSPTLREFERQALGGVEYTSLKPIGSTGKKADHGDIDCGIDTQLPLDQLGAMIEAAGFKVKVNKGLNEVNVDFPQYGPDGKENGKRCQIDLMVGPEAWTQFSYYAPSDTESKYKGVHSAALRTGILRVLSGFSTSPSRGYFMNKDPKKQYTQDPAWAAKEISKYSNEPWKVSDLNQPFEVMWEKAKRSFPPEQLEAIKKYVRDYLKGQAVPEELNESHADIGKRPPGFVMTKMDDLEVRQPEALEALFKDWEQGVGFEVDPMEFWTEYETSGMFFANKNYTKLCWFPKNEDQHYIFWQLGMPGWSLDPQDAGIDPKFLSEAAHMAYDKIQTVSTGGQVGQGNIGGPRNRGKVPKGMVPDTLRNKDLTGGGIETLDEAADPSELEGGIKHIDDLKPEQFMTFLRKYSNLPIEGGLEVSEKVDGSARLSFGVGGGHIWTQTKNGSRKAMSSQYPEAPMYVAIKRAHQALESQANSIIKNWPEGVAFMVAEVLYTKIPNTIEYGPNVLMIHGVHSAEGVLDDNTSKKFATQVIKSTGGSLNDGKDDWRFEYKRTITPADVMVDVRSEYDTLGQLYQSLQQKPRDKQTQEQFKQIQQQVKKKLLSQLHKQRSAYGPEGGDVEGIVFRDLESGAMTKLVDKDYFTKLNQFMWNWRKRIGKEVFDAFTKVVAEKVLGDTGLASTSLMRKLMTAQDPKDAKLTPEQQANKLIARYIKKNNLMTGDFFAEFQKSLMKANRDLAAIKKQYAARGEERFEYEIPTTGDKKVRTPGPEIAQRTESSIQQAEANLAGVKAGVEAAQGIKSELTKKVAIFKLFLGYKFQRLVDQLGGGQAQELDEVAIHPDRVRSKQALSDVLELYGEKLAQRVGKIPNRSMDFLGSGVRATALNLGGNKVLKITIDESDARAAVYFHDNPAKHFVKVYDVFRFPGEHKFVFGIVVERLAELSRREKEFVDGIMNIFEWKGLTWDQIKEKEREDFLAGPEMGPQTFEELVGNVEKYGIDEMIDEMVQHNFHSEDINRNNIMKRFDGTWVVSDMGFSTSPISRDIPVLEGFVKGAARSYPSDLGGDQVKPDDNRALEEMVHMFEAAGQSTVGATVGRFQPFHAGHAEMIRSLCRQFSKVLVFVAGQKLGPENPFSYELRIKMMEKSLPDVWNKIRVYPASIQGKGTGYIPGLIANVANAEGIDSTQPVTVLVGEDRAPAIEQQAVHNSQHQGESGYYNGVIEVEVLPGVKNDDDADRISGTKVRDAIAKDDKGQVRKLLDPHLSTDPASFEEIYSELTRGISPAPKPKKAKSKMLEDIVETIINEFGGGAGAGAGGGGGGVGNTRGGSFGSVSGLSSAPSFEDVDDLDIYKVKPATKGVLDMTNRGHANTNLPGIDSMGGEANDDEIRNPTDLSRVVREMFVRIAEMSKRTAATPEKKAEKQRNTDLAWMERKRAQGKVQAADRRKYNLLIQKYGLDVPPLADPQKAQAISVIDAEERWVPWDQKILDDLYPGEASKMKEFNLSSRVIGPGELRLIQFLGPDTHKNQTEDQTFDIIVGPEAAARNSINPGNYEVKSISATKQAFAGAKGNKYAYETLLRYKKMVNEINDFIGALDDQAYQAVIQQTGLRVDRLRYLIQLLTPQVVESGNLSSQSVEMLYELAQQMSEYVTQKRGEKIPVIIGGKEYLVEPHHLALLSRRSGIDLSSAGVGKEHIGKSHLKSPYFKNPQKVKDDSLQVVKPSEIFFPKKADGQPQSSDIEGIFVVDSKKGYAMIPKEDVDKYIKIAGIGKHQLKITLTRPLPSGNHAKSKGDFPVSEPPSVEG